MPIPHIKAVSLAVFTATGIFTVAFTLWHLRIWPLDILLFSSILVASSAIVAALATGATFSRYCWGRNRLWAIWAAITLTYTLSATGWTLKTVAPFIGIGSLELLGESLILLSYPPLVYGLWNYLAAFRGMWIYTNGVARHALPIAAGAITLFTLAVLVWMFRTALSRGIYPPRLVLLAASPILDSLILILAIPALVLFWGARLRLPWLFLTVGFIAISLGDGYRSITHLLENFYVGHPSALLLAFGYLSVAAGALLHRWEL